MLNKNISQDLKIYVGWVILYLCLYKPGGHLAFEVQVASGEGKGKRE